MAKRKVHLVTKEGLEKLKEKLKVRTTEKREEIKNTLEDMRSKGDLSENDGYTLALQDLESNEIEIAKLEETIKNAKIVAAKRNGKIEMGDKVAIVDSKGKEMTYELVGENDTDPLNGKISYISPLGSAIIGRKKGETFTFETPRGKVEYKITKVIED